MEMIQIRTEIRRMGFPEKLSLEKSSFAGSQTKDSRSVCLFACIRYIWKSLERVHIYEININVKYVSWCNKTKHKSVA